MAKCEEKQKVSCRRGGGVHTHTYNFPGGDAEKGEQTPAMAISTAQRQAPGPGPVYQNPGTTLRDVLVRKRENPVASQLRHSSFRCGFRGGQSFRGNEVYSRRVEPVIRVVVNAGAYLLLYRSPGEVRSRGLVRACPAKLSDISGSGGSPGRVPIRESDCSSSEPSPRTNQHAIRLKNQRQLYDQISPEPQSHA